MKTNYHYGILNRTLMYLNNKLNLMNDMNIYIKCNF